MVNMAFRRVCAGLSVMTVAAGCNPFSSSEAVPQSAMKSFTGPSGATTVIIPKGYYDGTQTASVMDPNLIPANIANGKTIFGVRGIASLGGSSGLPNCTSNGQTGCVANASFVSGAPASSFVMPEGVTKEIVPPAGYYDGSTQKITVHDNQLAVGNIRSGVKIFDVLGELEPEAHSPCTSAGQTGCVATATFRTQAIPNTAAAEENVLAGKQFSIGGAVLTGSMPNHGAAAITPQATQQTKPAGYYSGVTVSGDGALIPLNIKDGVTIFGVEGDAVMITGSTGAPAAATHILDGKEAWGADGTKMTGTMTNHGTLNLASSWPGAGYYADYSNPPPATQVCAGTAVFGVTGSASCGAGGGASNAHRNRTTTQISRVEETTTYANQALPEGYREVPDISQDDTGIGQSGVDTAQVSSTLRPGANCGTNQNTIAARIQHCFDVNGARATWDGTTRGNTGQGVWKLVTRLTPEMGAEKEVWQDQRTMLLWSSMVSTADNWCRAAGNRQTDPSGICDSVSYQSYPTAAQSWCAETDPNPMDSVSIVPVLGSAENWATGTYVSAKGGMGKTPTATSPAVHWRLPTKYDYQLADNHGIRFVMPDTKGRLGEYTEWSATVLVSVALIGRGRATVFDNDTGEIGSYNRADYMAVRCVGRSP